MSVDRTASLGDLRIDPATPGFFLRPDYYEVLARLRAEDPVHEFAPGIKAVTRYHDIREISRDPTVLQQPGCVDERPAPR